MPIIRIDEEVWQLLKANAEPLKDSPNDVLRRKLGLPPKISKRQPRSGQRWTEQEADRILFNIIKGEDKP